MRRWRLGLVLLTVCCLADDRWVMFSHRGIEALTNAGERPGREALARFVQFQHSLGQVLRIDELDSHPPLRILIFRNEAERSRSCSGQMVRMGRDRFVVSLAADAQMPREVFKSCARHYLETSVERLPPVLERGLIELYSTIQIAATRITLGAPVPEAERSKEWARLHMMATDPDYSGKVRVLFYNLRRGVDEGVAYRNAFAKSPPEVERDLERYVSARNYQTVPLSGLPISPERDFRLTPLSPDEVQLALADLLLPQSSAIIYQALLQKKTLVAESEEGLGLLALGEKRREEARLHFASAIGAQAKSARPYLEYARLESAPDKARAALEKALSLNPKLAEAHFLMAAREPELGNRSEHLKAAANLEPRRIDYWRALAENYIAAHDYRSAAKAWTAAEQAATTDAEKTGMRQARAAIEQQRLDYEAAERKRIEDEKQREIQKLKEQALAELRALEAKASQGSTVKPDEKVEPWWDGPKPQGKVAGFLRQVDCKGKIPRLVIQNKEDGKVVQLLLRNPSQVAIIGGGEQSLACGPQKERPVVVEYFPKQDGKTATAGDVATIEFR